MADITSYRPMTQLNTLRNELDRFFGDLIPRSGDGDGETFASVWKPRMDLSETEGAYLVRMDLPGIEKNQVSVNVEDRALTVRGERKEEQRKEGENYLRVERSYGSFYRSLPLPRSANVDDVKAEFENGVLKIRIAKAEEHKPKKIKIA